MDYKFLTYLSNIFASSSAIEIKEWHSAHTPLTQYCFEQYPNLARWNEYYKTLLSFSGELKMKQKELREFLFKHIPSVSYAPTVKLSDYITDGVISDCDGLIETKYSVDLINGETRSYVDYQRDVTQELQNILDTRNKDFVVQTIASWKEVNATVDAQLRTLISQCWYEQTVDEYIQTRIPDLEEFIEIELAKIENNLDIKKYVLRSKKIVNTSLDILINTLPVEFFTLTPALISFYNYYTKEDDKNLYIVYTNYITRNMEKVSDDDEETEVQIATLIERISDQIGRDEYVLVSRIADVLSDALENSRVVLHKIKDVAPCTEEEEEKKIENRQHIIDKIIEEGGNIPVPIPDLRFANCVKLMNVYRDTLEACSDIREKNSKSDKLCTVNYFNLAHFTSTSNVVETKALEEPYYDVLPPTVVNRVTKPKQYDGVIRIIPKTPIQYINETNDYPLYICSGSIIAHCSNAENGILNNESYISYCSTYTMAVSKTIQAYPLSLYDGIYTPAVICFKDHNFQRITEWKPFRVLTHGMKLNPSEMDYRDILQKLYHILEFAIFYNQTRVIFDDFDCVSNNTNVRAVGLILQAVLREYKHKFDCITICVSAEIYEIWKGYFM